MHYRHEVSAKIAIYSDDAQMVLVMRYPKMGRTGLPGGHVEKNEKPDDALRRELIEELGLSIETVVRKDFFLRERNKGSVILAYTASLPLSAQMSPPVPKYEHGEWISRQELDDTIDISDDYRDFIIQNWPTIKA